MQLSKTGYYADFAIYATVVSTATVVTAARSSAYDTSIWLLTLALGFLLWTLVEYLVHRFVLHRIPPFAAMHAVHHEAPRALVGTPTWMSFGTMLLVVLLPPWWYGSITSASALTAGIMSGFFWYSVVHHAIHFRRPRWLATHLIRASRRHAQHHYGLQPCNFGVTMPLWDDVFGTALSARTAGRVQAE